MLDTQSTGLTRQDTATLKGVAIIGMLCHHLFAYPPEWVGLPDSPLLLWLGAIGKVCVAIFLFCSGYGLSVQCYEKNPRGIRGMAGFIMRRFVKFYANYWVVFLLFVPLTVFAFGRPLSSAYGDSVSIPIHLVLDLLGVQGFHSYNITWWFNLLIVVFYLLFPLIYQSCRTNVWVTLTVALLFCAISGKVGTGYGTILLIYVLPFTMGVAWPFCQPVLHRLFSYAGQHRLLFLMCCLGGISVCLFFRQRNLLPGGFYGEKIDGFIAGIMALSIIGLRSFFSPFGVLSFVGKHAGNMYMTHTFVNVYWPTSRLIHGELTWVGRLVTLFFISLLLSMMIEWIKEKTRYYQFVNKRIRIAG